MALHEHIETAHGPVLVINMQSQSFLVTGAHVHGCPTCDERVPCEMRCSVEPDLTLDDGTLCGAYVECDACESLRTSQADGGGE